MKKFFWFVLAVFVVVFSTRVYAFYSSDKVEETRPLKGFERIRLQGSPDIKYTQGKTWSVRVKAPKSMIKNVKTHVEGNCLVVSLKDNNVFSWGTIKGEEITVYLTVRHCWIPTIWKSVCAVLAMSTSATLSATVSRPR